MFLVEAASGDHLDVQGLCRSGPTLTERSALESWAHLLPLTALRRVTPTPHSGSTVELALMAGLGEN